MGLFQRLADWNWSQAQAEADNPIEDNPPTPADQFQSELSNKIDSVSQTNPQANTHTKIEELPAIPLTSGQRAIFENEYAEHRRKLQAFAAMLKRREADLDARENELTASAKRKAAKIIKDAEETRDSMLADAANKFARINDDIEWETAHLAEIMRDIDGEMEYLERLRADKDEKTHI